MRGVKRVSLLAHGWQVCAASDTPALWCNRARAASDTLGCINYHTHHRRPGRLSIQASHSLGSVTWESASDLASWENLVLCKVDNCGVEAATDELSSRNCIRERQGHYETGWCCCTWNTQQILSQTPKLHHQYAAVCFLFNTATGRLSLLKEGGHLKRKWHNFPRFWSRNLNPESWCWNEWIVVNRKLLSLWWYCFVWLTGAGTYKNEAVIKRWARTTSRNA